MAASGMETTQMQQQEDDGRGHGDDGKSQGASQVAFASAKVAAAKAELQALLTAVEDVDVSSQGAVEQVEAAMGDVRRSMQSLTALASRH